MMNRHPLSIGGKKRQKIHDFTKKSWIEAKKLVSRRFIPTKFLLFACDTSQNGNTTK